MLKYFVFALILFKVSFAYAETAEDFFQKGKDAENSGDLKKAITFYKKSKGIDYFFEPAKRALYIAERNESIQNFKKKVDQKCLKENLNEETKLYCLKKYFTFKGELIHPKIINDFIPWISDDGSLITSINLEGAVGSNRYFDNDEFTRHGTSGATLNFSYDHSSEPIEAEHCKRTECYFSYYIEGIIDNRIFVITTRESGGGSGVFSNLLLLKIKKWRGLMNENVGKEITLSSPQIILEKIGHIILGDRRPYKVLIKDDDLIVNGKIFNLKKLDNY